MCDDVDAEWRAMSQVARIDALVSLEARIAALQAAQYRLLAVIDADPPTVSVPPAADKHWAVEDVACALRLSTATARSRLAEASELSRLPETLQLLSDGLITSRHAGVLAEATMSLDDETARAIQRRVLQRADQQTVGTFRQSVRRAVLALDSRSVEMQRVANVAERRLCVRPGGEGTTELWALLPDEGAAALMAAVTALAARHDSADPRTADQRRADALVQLGLDGLAGKISRVLPRRQRIRPTVQVTVALSTLLGLDDEAGELAGVGAISASAARELAADPSGRWRRLVTDKVGRLVDYGRSIYRPPTNLARYVMARDRTCRFPMCTRTAEHSELDHTVPWSEGGPTNAANLVALCSRHHHLRHETEWSYASGDDDVGITWRSPTGLTYAVPGATYPEDIVDGDTSRGSVTGPDPPPPF